MKLRFTKMHGLGNDFIVLDGVRQSIDLSAEQIRDLAHRQLGIGFDQLLLVETTQSAEADFRYRIFNADGDEVEQCGNGARCFARFVQDQGLTTKQTIVVQTNTGLIMLKTRDDGLISVDMGRPELTPNMIPFDAETQALSYAIQIAEETYHIGAVSMGNPHAVLQVDSVAEAPVLTLGPLLERHPRFPNGANIGFMEVVHPGYIRLRVFERVVGETLACGSGACAAMVVGRLQGLLNSEAKVDLPGGSLQIHYDITTSVTMTGPSSQVYTGEIEL